MNEISSFRKMLNIQRLSGTFKHRSYSLAEHSYYVAILFQHFAKRIGITYGVDTLDVVLKHDLLETETGDLIYTVKNFSKLTKSHWTEIEEEILKKFSWLEPYSDTGIDRVLTPVQKRLFKACDLLELWIFLQEEYSIGNRNWSVIEISNRCVDLIKSYCGTDLTIIVEFIENYVPWEEK